MPDDVRFPGTARGSPVAGTRRECNRATPAPTAAPQVPGRAHRLHFSFEGRKFLESGASKQDVMFPGCPEDNARPLELLRVESEHLVRQRNFPHVPKMLVEKSEHLWPGNVVDFDPHRKLLSEVRYVRNRYPKRHHTNQERERRTEGARQQMKVDIEFNGRSLPGASADDPCDHGATGHILAAHRTFEPVQHSTVAFG
jgi:hypothetical protein